MPSYTPVKYFGAESKEQPLKRADHSVIVEVRPNADRPDTPFVRIAYETMQQDSIGDAFACSTAQHAVSGKVALSMAQDCAAYFNASAILIFDPAGVLADVVPDGAVRKTAPERDEPDAKTKTVPTRWKRGGAVMVA